MPLCYVGKATLLITTEIIIAIKKYVYYSGLEGNSSVRSTSLIKWGVAVASYTTQLWVLLVKSDHCLCSCVSLSLLLFTSVSAGKEIGGRPGPWQQAKLVTFPAIMWLQLIPSKQRSMFSFGCKEPLVLYLKEVWGVGFDWLQWFFKWLTLFLFQYLTALINN